jgi:3-polyprenyl-4-hydroxybenzoate decarboxylase
MPAFYHQPATIEDLPAHTAGKILDQFDIDHELFRRWSGPACGLPGEKPGNDA